MATHAQEVRYGVKESVIKELYTLCSEIAGPKTAYKESQLSMANDVIADNNLNAQTIRSILDKIIADMYS